MDAFERLAEVFQKFPGIGGRQARRFVYFLLQSDPHYIDEFIQAVSAVRQSIAQCARCYRYFEKHSGAVAGRSGATLDVPLLCNSCSSPNSDTALLLVVEKDVDLESITKSSAYHGRYFVLGGTVPVLENDPSAVIRSRELFSEIQRRAQREGLQEVILALSATAEGDNTTAYLQKVLAPLGEKFKVTISVLGRGLSSGSELEYADPETLRNALRGRS